MFMSESEYMHYFFHTSYSDYATSLSMYDMYKYSVLDLEHYTIVCSKATKCEIKTQFLLLYD